MLKRTAILLLCLVYTINVYGLAFNVNYCFGQISSVKVGPGTSNCPLCHSVAKKKCCKTSHIEVKVKDAHLVSANNLLAKALAFTAVIPHFNSFTPVWQQAHYERVLHHGQNAPPPDKDLILIKNCTFRI